MKHIVKISLSSLTSQKSKTLVTILGLTLSVALITIVSGFCLGLVDLQWIILKGDYSAWGFSGEIMQQKILRDSDMILVIGICVLFTLIASTGATVAMYNTLSINLGDKARTLSVLSTLGAKQWHKATLLFLDALWVALMAIPMGISVGIAAIYPLIGILNRLFTAEYHSIDAIPFLHDTPALFIFVIATLSLITIALASLHPALRLFGGTAIEIAKSSNKINVSLKESLLDKLMAKKFGITGRLAATNYINNRRHYRQLSLSLSLSSLILVLFSLMVRYMTSNGVTTDGDPIAKQFYYTVIFVILIIFSVSAFSAFCVLYVSFDRRKGEFAVLRSMGTEDAMLYKMVLLEALYYCVYMLIFIFVGSVVIDVTLYSFIVMGEPRTAFIFPLSEILIALGTVITVTAILCMIMTAVVKKSNIITELKKSY